MASKDTKKVASKTTAASAKKTVAKAAPKKVVAKAAPKKVVAKAEPKKVVAKAEPKKVVAKAVPKKTVAKTTATKATAKTVAVKKVVAKTAASKTVKTSNKPAVKATTSVKTTKPSVKTERVANPIILNDATDDDILKMPDSEYMNNTQLLFFKRKLEQLKNQLLNSAGLTTDHLRENATMFPDPADRATVEEEHALELRTRDRERKLLKKIELAITRIDTGDYGYCEETGEPIGIGRLLARPTATLSIEAQQRRELKQKLFGD